MSCRSSVCISPPFYQLVVIIIKLGLPLPSFESQRILGKCMNCKSIMQMSREREKKKGPALVFALFFSIRSGPQSSKWELAHASHFLLGIQETPRGSVCRGFLTRCSTQMGRQLNGHNVDLWSLVDYSGTFGAQLFIQQHTKGGEQVFLSFLL